jgi:hypothetical protein
VSRGCLIRFHVSLRDDNLVDSAPIGSYRPSRKLDAVRGLSWRLFVLDDLYEDDLHEDYLCDAVVDVCCE